MYPFIPETVLLDKAAYATAMGVEKVAGGVKKGVVSAGVRVMAVPGRIERGRAKGKIKWLQGKGFVEVAGEGEGEGTEGAERGERVRVVPRAASTAARSGQERPRADRPRTERPRERRSRAQTPREERLREERSGEVVSSEVRDACIAYWHLGAVV